MVNPKRITPLRSGREKAGPVVYWMNRDQRAADNWALLGAQATALQRKEPLLVVFCLAPRFLNATMRHYSFMLKGLQQVEEALHRKGIPLFLLTGSPTEAVPRFLSKIDASTLITDFFPLRIKEEWIKGIADRIEIPFCEVDAHNIVPCWEASPKQEYGAYTLRPKIRRALPEFLENFPPLRKHPIAWTGETPSNDWASALKTIEAGRHVPDLDWIQPGEKAARRMLREFIQKRLRMYPALSNDPAADAQSHLSAYLHFGQISAQRVALEVSGSGAGRAAKDAFLEQIIVRRELSDNFCFHNPHYDSLDGFPNWAKKTLEAHRSDRRDYVYSPEQLETAQTHDDLWNAAQLEMVKRGAMHGYMRMYWCKKILEWTESPEEAMRIAIRLNDTYEIDGPDPNGYVGVAWSIGGVHDRPWQERPVFGKIRYMSYNGCKSKFDVKAYIARARRP